MDLRSVAALDLSVGSVREPSPTSTVVPLAMLPEKAVIWPKLARVVKRAMEPDV